MSAALALLLDARAPLVLFGAPPSEARRLVVVLFGGVGGKNEAEEPIGDTAPSGLPRGEGTLRSGCKLLLFVCTLPAPWLSRLLVGVVLRFPLPLELMLLVDEPCGDLEGRDTGTTLRLAFEGVRVEPCQAGPAEDGPGRFAAPLMVSRFTEAEGDLARDVGAGDFDRAAAGAGDFARVEVVFAGDLTPVVGPKDDRELRLEVEDPW